MQVQPNRASRASAVRIVTGVLTLFAAACGSQPASVDTDPVRVRSCLRDAKVRVSTDTDLVTADAGKANIAARFKRNRANIAIERTEGDANKMERDHEAFMDEEGAEERLWREGVTVIRWDKAPEGAEARVVERCTGVSA